MTDLPIACRLPEDDGPVRLEVTEPPGSREFLESTFDLAPGGPD